MRRGGLNDDFASHRSASRPACDLGEQLKGALTGAEVGGVERKIGIEDTDEGDIGKVESLGDHLGAEQDVDLFCAEVAEGIAQGVLAPRSVGVESRDFRGGEDFTEDVFGFFGAVSLKTNGGVAALGTKLGHDGLMTADVTDESFVSAMIGEWNSAVIAFNDVAAGRTLQGAGKAASVQEENDLLVRFEALVDG